MCGAQDIIEYCLKDVIQPLYKGIGIVCGVLTA